MAEGNQFAVLTGDIVASSRANNGAGNRVLEWILSAERAVRDHQAADLHAGVDIFRGDSWQMVLLEPARALRAALLFRASLLSSAGIDTRIAIGLGGVDYLPEENISTGTGEAFTLSGKGLAALQRPARMSISFPGQRQTSLTRALKIILALIDFQVQSWTRKQAAAVAGALAGLTQQQIAEGWEGKTISQQAVSQHLDHAGWSQIENSLVFFEWAIPLVLGGEE